MPMWHIQHLTPGGISEKASKGNQNYSYFPRDVSLARCASCHQVSLGRSRLWYRTQSDVDPFSSVNLSKLKIRKNLFTKISLVHFYSNLFTFFCPTSNVSHFYRTQVNLGSDLWVRMSITMPPCWDLTDVTLDDEDANSILTDNAKRAIQGNVGNTSYATWWPTLQTMQVPPPDDQMLNQSKLCHLVAKYATYAGGAIWWLNLQLIHVVPSGGQIFN